MRMRQLGANGPMVSAIGLGCLSFGGTFGATTRAASLACLDAAWDQGITFYDTANIYGAGLSEDILGEWLRTRRRPAILATKASFVPGTDRRIDNSAAHLRHELQGSLRRLGRDHVDLFYIHRHEKSRPIEEVADSMARLEAEGLIGGYGMSEVSPGTLRRAHAVHPCRAIQNEYSLWTRQPDLGLIAACAELGVAFVPFSPLARGVLGQAMLDPATLDPSEFHRRIPRLQGVDWHLNKALISRFHDWCAARGHKVPAVALAWVLSRGPHLIPIPGTRTAEHLGDWKGADSLTLTPHDLAEIETLLPAGFAFGDRYDDDQAATVERYC
jgi:aryl-alcohol dehydrogenase-like predicted oxidoreductase